MTDLGSSSVGRHVAGHACRSGRGAGVSDQRRAGARPPRDAEEAGLRYRPCDPAVPIRETNRLALRAAMPLLETRSRCRPGCSPGPRRWRSAERERDPSAADRARSRRKSRPAKHNDVVAAEAVAIFSRCANLGAMQPTASTVSWDARIRRDPMPPGPLLTPHESRPDMTRGSPESNERAAGGPLVSVAGGTPAQAGEGFGSGMGWAGPTMVGVPCRSCFGGRSMNIFSNSSESTVSSATSRSASARACPCGSSGPRWPARRPGR